MAATSLTALFPALDAPLTGPVISNEEIQARERLWGEVVALDPDLTSKEVLDLLRTDAYWSARVRQLAAAIVLDQVEANEPARLEEAKKVVETVKAERATKEEVDSFEDEKTEPLMLAFDANDVKTVEAGECVTEDLGVVTFEVNDDGFHDMRFDDVDLIKDDLVTVPDGPPVMSEEKVEAKAPAFVLPKGASPCTHPACAKGNGFTTNPHVPTLKAFEAELGRTPTEAEVRSRILCLSHRRAGSVPLNEVLEYLAAIVVATVVRGVTAKAEARAINEANRLKNEERRAAEKKQREASKLAKKNPPPAREEKKNAGKGKKRK